jgi:hypothetical protein
LGGRYYRGNDERDPLLFNHGFYRTATIDLSLQDTAAEGTVLQPGDPVTGTLFVELLIEKAPGASPRLYTQAILDQVFLTREWLPDWEATQSEGEPMQLEAITEGELWRARIPVEVTDGTRATGSIYIYRGDREGQSITKVNKQYGIHYDLLITDGTLSPDSELWMGSMTRHPWVVYTAPGQVPATEFFDFRPIPIISGANSTDPELLGIEPGADRQ